MQHREAYKGYVADVNVEKARDDSGSGWTYSLYIEEHVNDDIHIEQILASRLYAIENEALMAAVRAAKDLIDSKEK